jgi:hypothetical protein
MSIAEKCERLVAAYEAKGIAVRSNLKPGLSRDEIVAKTAALTPASSIELANIHGDAAS